MQIKLATFILGLVVFGAVGGAGTYFYKEVVRERASTETLDEIAATDGTNSSSDQGGAVITVIPPETDLPKPIPNLDRPIVISEKEDPTIRANTEKRMKEIVASLKENPRQASVWNELGIYRKAIQDYTGAHEALIYSSKLSPNDYIALANLGNMYALEPGVRDNKKAEEYFLLAQKRAPRELIINAYLYELYHDVLKDLDKAVLVAKDAADDNPDNEELQKFYEAVLEEQRRAKSGE